MRVFSAAYPLNWLGAHSVVVAEDEGHAKRLIIKTQNVAERDIELKEIDTANAGVEVLFNGDY